MGELVNEFSWSASRAAKFEACPRAYYYHYYASWGGWEAEAHPETRELWILKKLTSRQAWAGTAVHDTIAWVLSRLEKGRPLPDLDEALERTLFRMRREFVESREGAYRRRRALGLVEHEYQEPLDDSVWRDNWQRARTSLEGFYGSQVLQDVLAADPLGFFPIDTLDTFTFEGVKVYAAPDFAYRTPVGRVRIIDWKTGRPKDRDREQVLGYALFAQDRWEVPADRIDLELWYLAEAEPQVTVAAGSEELARCQAGIRSSIQAMQALLADVDANRPRRDAFEPAPDASGCRYCNFRRLCPDAAAAA